MLTVAMGAAVFAATGTVFLRCLPRDGRYHRFVGTAWEPYVAVAFCGAMALSFTMMLSGILDLLG